MPLLPNQPFTEGDEWTPELAYLACSAPVYDDQPQYLGHRERLGDGELSNDPSALKGRFSAVADSLKVAVESGLTLRYASGILGLPDGSNLTVASSLLVAPNNATSYIWATSTGTIAVGSTPPVIRCLLARVVTVSNVVTVLEDLRHLQVRPVQPIAASVKTFGGSNGTDKTCTANEVLDQGLYYFRDFTVPAGITITVDKSAKILCSGNVSIAGTVNVTQQGLAPVNVGTILTGYNSTASGNASPQLGARGVAYPWGAQNFGTGGSQGAVTCLSSTVSTAGWFGVAGDGGGGLWIEASGGITVTGTINARGANGGRGALGQSNTPGNVQAGVFGLVNGCGGGSGGLVYLSSLSVVTVSATATIDVRGGAGGDAVANTNGANAVALGGLGGGGGYVVCSAPTINTTGATLNLAGGTWGQPAGTGFTIAGATVTLTTPNTAGGNALGGAYGGISGSNSYTTSTSISLVAGGIGKLILRNFTPIG